MHLLNWLKQWAPRSMRYVLRFGLVAPLLDQDARATLVSVARLRLRSTQPKVLFYDRFPVHYGFSRPVILEVIRRCPVVLLVGEREHEAYRMPPTGVEVVFVSRRYEIYMRFLRARVLVTVASGFAPYARPTGSLLVHMFHSLVSMHVVYARDSFDAYDYFFAAGPHHLREFRALREARQWLGKEIYPVGYLKVDELAAAMERCPDDQRKRATVLLAPSWGDTNLLRADSLSLIREMIQAGWKVIVRPHPHSYDYDVDIIDAIRKFTESSVHCVLDGPVGAQESLLEADVMISDWSGVAYEFAFATARPVVFVDVPQKVSAAREQLPDLPAMEVICREEIGILTSRARIVENVGHLLAERYAWRERIARARERYLYNFGNSKQVAAHQIWKLAGA